jgi:hypothetical protein
MISNYVIVVYVSSDPGTYMILIQFTLQNWVWHRPSAGQVGTVNPPGLGPSLSGVKIFTPSWLSPHQRARIVAPARITARGSPAARGNASEDLFHFTVQ